MTTKIPIKTGTIDTFTDSGERVKWKPSSELTLVEDSESTDSYDGFGFPRKIAANPSAVQAAKEFSTKGKRPVKDVARMMVGFNVGSKPTWRPGQVYLCAYLLREEQVKGKKTAPAFSFYVGLGAFPGETLVSSERSAQIVFMNFGQKSIDFNNDMFILAESIGTELLQESVLLELQSGGEIVYLDYIDSNRKRWPSLGDAKDWLDENKGRIEPSVWRTK